MIFSPLDEWLANSKRSSSAVLDLSAGLGSRIRRLTTNAIRIGNRHHQYTHKGHWLKFSEKYYHTSGEFPYIFQYRTKFYVYTIYKRTLHINSFHLFCINLFYILPYKCEKLTKRYGSINYLSESDPRKIRITRILRPKFLNTLRVNHSNPPPKNDRGSTQEPSEEHHCHRPSSPHGTRRCYIYWPPASCFTGMLAGEAQPFVVTAPTIPWAPFSRPCGGGLEPTDLRERWQDKFF